jgi:hypothetical protein
MAVPQDIMLMSDDYNPRNIQKNTRCSYVQQNGLLHMQPKVSGPRQAQMNVHLILLSACPPTNTLGYVWEEEILLT